jgi:hypothetical protein
MLVIITKHAVLLLLMKYLILFLNKIKIKLTLKYII